MNTQRHLYHLVNSSPWPLITSIGAYGLTTGGVLFFHFFSKGSTVFFLGLITVVLAVSVWWRDVIREGTYEGHHTSVVQKGLRLGMILFIVSEVMFFASFFWAFFHSSLAPVIEIGSIWPPIEINVFNPWEVPFLNTLVLLLSGATITWAHHAIINGNKDQCTYGMGTTILWASFFTILQLCEYVEATFAISDGVYGSVFFMATGFHGFHVIIGTIFILVCFFRHLYSQFSQFHHVGFLSASWYWHFVDVVWLFLFVVVYWWGNYLPMFMCYYPLDTKKVRADTMLQNVTAPSLFELAPSIYAVVSIIFRICALITLVASYYFLKTLSFYNFEISNILELLELMFFQFKFLTIFFSVLFIFAVSVFFFGSTYHLIIGTFKLFIHKTKHGFINSIFLILKVLFILLSCSFFYFYLFIFVDQYVNNILLLEDIIYQTSFPLKYINLQSKQIETLTINREVRSYSAYTNLMYKASYKYYLKHGLRLKNIAFSGQAIETLFWNRFLCDAFLIDLLFIVKLINSGIWFSLKDSSLNDIFSIKLLLDSCVYEKPSAPKINYKDCILQPADEFSTKYTMVSKRGGLLLRLGHPLFFQKFPLNPDASNTLTSNLMYQKSSNISDFLFCDRFSQYLSRKCRYRYIFHKMWETPLLYKLTQGTFWLMDLYSLSRIYLFSHLHKKWMNYDNYFSHVFTKPTSLADAQSQVELYISKNRLNQFSKPVVYSILTFLDCKAARASSWYYTKCVENVSKSFYNHDVSKHPFFPLTRIQYFAGHDTFAFIENTKLCKYKLLKKVGRISKFSINFMQRLTDYLAQDAAFRDRRVYKGYKYSKILQLPHHYSYNFGKTRRFSMFTKDYFNFYLKSLDTLVYNYLIELNKVNSISLGSSLKLGQFCANFRDVQNVMTSIAYMYKQVIDMRDITNSHSLIYLNTCGLNIKFKPKLYPVFTSKLFEKISYGSLLK